MFFIGGHSFIGGADSLSGPHGLQKDQEATAQHPVSPAFCGAVGFPGGWLPFKVERKRRQDAEIPTKLGLRFPAKSDEL